MSIEFRKDNNGLEYAKQKRALAKKIFERASNELQQKAVEQSLSPTKSEPTVKEETSTVSDVSSEVKVTEENYKDIPSQKIEFKDGVAFVHKDSENGNDHLFISRLDVANKGKGTGSEFLKKIENYAKENGLKQLAAIPETEASKKFFEKNGFVDNDGMLIKDLQPTNEAKANEVQQPTEVESNAMPPKLGYVL